MSNVENMNRETSLGWIEINKRREEIYTAQRGKKICFTCHNADENLFCRHWGQMDGDDDCSLWKE